MTTKLTDERRRELERALDEMKHASSLFYRMATHIGVHPFIEFTGLMNEYIKCCEQALRDGIDYSMCNTHTGQPLPMRPFEVDYVNEKLECIYLGRVALRPGAD